MPRRYLFFIAILLMQLQAIASAPENLRTNALKNPVMVDTPAPKFSWTMGDDLKRGTKQSSYRIIITDRSGGNIWDSGVREGEDNCDVEYDGPSLEPLTRYCWSVTTVDSNGKEEKSSEKAWFETGLMDSGWHNAKWITPSIKKTEESDVKRYAVEADIEIANVSVGIIFGATDHFNYYMWQFNLEDGYPRFRPHHWTNNAAACDAEIDLRGVKEFSINKPFHVRIEVNEDIVYTYIDGVLIDTRQQSDGSIYPYGDVAIRQDYALWNSSNPEKAYFDNIKIYDLTDGGESELISLDFEDGVNPFDSGNIVNGRLYVSGSYAWPRKIYDISDNSYDLGMSLRVIRDSAGVLFSADDRYNTHMWSLVVKGSAPILRRHIRQGGNWKSSDVNLSTFTSCSSLKSKNHDFQIQVRGNVIDSYLDGEKIDSYEDNSGTLHYGKTGFRIFHDGSNNEEFLCDNITLRKYKTSDASDEGILVFAEDFESAGHVFPEGVVRTIEGNKMLSLSSVYDEKIVFAESETDGMPLMRREITVKGEIKEARISAAALGVFDLRVNGKRVGSADEDGTLRYDELKPGWTDYRSSVNYYSYDITDLMREGKNVIGAELSNGWWAGAIAHGVYGSDTPLSFIARIDISYADGSSETVITDELWKSANCGPLIYGDIYNGAGTSFGDWLAYEDLDARYVNVAYYAYDATLMANMAVALGMEEDAGMYRKLHDDIAAEFRERYVKDDNLTITSQTACLLALAFDLLSSDKQRQNVIETLRGKYIANGYKLQTGFVGTGLLNTTLSACGLDDIAYNLLLQRDNPSWLYSVDQGATTIWERWDSYTLDGGFNKHPWIMNSFNHYAYGVIYEWMMRYMAGIEYDENAPGFKHIKLQPHPDRRQTLPTTQKPITSVSASTRTPQGTVSSEWKKTGSDSFTYKVKVPVGSTATMYIPVNDENCTVSESGKPIDEAEGVSYKGFRDGKLIIDLLSGSYEFNVVDKEASVKEVRYEKIRISPNPFFDVLSVEGIPEGDPVSVVGINGQVVYNDVYKGKIDTSS